jgi:hypothetical protein
VTLVVLALVWAWGFVALASVMNRRWLGVLGFATALHWHFYMGFFSFVLAQGVGLFLLAYAAHRPLQGFKPRLIVGGGLLLVSVFHVFAALLTGVLVLALAVARAEPGRRWRAGLIVALLGVPAAIPAAISLLGIVDNEQAASALVASPDFSVGEKLVLLARAFATGPFWRAWPPVLLAGAGTAWIVSRLIQRKEVNSRESALLGVGVLFALCAVLFPVHAEGWEYVSMRFTPFAISVLALLCPLFATPSQRWTWPVRGALVSYALA